MLGKCVVPTDVTEEGASLLARAVSKVPRVTRIHSPRNPAGRNIVSGTLMACLPYGSVVPEFLMPKKPEGPVPQIRVPVEQAAPSASSTNP